MGLVRTLLLGIVVALPGMAPLHAAEGDDQRYPTVIEVYTDSSHPVLRVPLPSSTRLTIFHIDGLVQVQNMLSEGLPADPDEATRIATERLEAQRDALAPLLNEAGEGLSRATFTHGLDRYPAVIVSDDRATDVVYGVTDLHEILTIYRKDRGDN